VLEVAGGMGMGGSGVEGGTCFVIGGGTEFVLGLGFWFVFGRFGNGFKDARLCGLKTLILG